MVNEAIKFTSGLEFILTQGLPQEKLIALRQCIEKVYINKPDHQIKKIGTELEVILKDIFDDDPVP